MLRPLQLKLKLGDLYFQGMVVGTVQASVPYPRGRRLDYAD